NRFSSCVGDAAPASTWDSSVNASATATPNQHFIVALRRNLGYGHDCRDSANLPRLGQQGDAAPARRASPWALETIGRAAGDSPERPRGGRGEQRPPSNTEVDTASGGCRREVRVTAAPPIAWTRLPSRLRTATPRAAIGGSAIGAPRGPRPRRPPGQRNELITVKMLGGGGSPERRACAATRLPLLAPRTCRVPGTRTRDGHPDIARSRRRRQAHGGGDRCARPPRQESSDRRRRRKRATGPRVPAPPPPR